MGGHASCLGLRGRKHPSVSPGNTTVLVIASCAGTFDALPHTGSFLSGRRRMFFCSKGRIVSQLHFGPHPGYSVRSDADTGGWGDDMP